MRWTILLVFAGWFTAFSAFGTHAEAAHFAVIRPEADDEPQLEPGAAWLYRPRKPDRQAGSPVNTRKTKGTVQKAGPGGDVTPLKRNRPLREVNPPKTRRRQLGW